MISELEATRAKVRKMRKELRRLTRAHALLKFHFRDQVKREQQAHAWRMQYQNAYFWLRGKIAPRWYKPWTWDIK